MPIPSAGRATRVPNTHSAIARGVFERPAETFALDHRVIGWILDDPANPLHRIAQLIPEGAVVLDVGAGNGILARLLQTLGKSVNIDAVEPDPVAQEGAAPYYRTIFPGALEEYLESSLGHEVRYDYIVMADVVEHLSNPEPILRNLASLLLPGGSMVLSTPNVAFASVRIALLNGFFDYVDSGILERTHLRFFTRSTLHKLLTNVGLYPHAEMLLKRNPMNMEVGLAAFRVTPWTLAWVLRDRLSSVYQFLYVLGPKPVEVVSEEEYGSAGRFVVLSYLKARALQRLRRFRPPFCINRVRG